MRGVWLVAFVATLVGLRVDRLLAKVLVSHDSITLHHIPTAVVPQITDEQRRAFERDGVVKIDGLLSPEWVTEMGQAIDAVVDDPRILAAAMRAGKGYTMDAWLWTTSDAFRDFVYHSGCAQVAQQILGSETVTFFYDQLFVKETGSPAPTPWHQDLPFWPIRHEGSDGAAAAAENNEGDQIMSMWIAFDHVSVESSGLEYVKGSHKWPERFRSVSPDYNPVLLDSDLPMPPQEYDRTKYDVVSFDCKPGDAILFHPLTMHGSGPNNSTTQRRRALALRWLGDNVVYQSKPGSFEKLLLWDHGLQDGQRVHGPLFPQMLPSQNPEESKIRDAGPMIPTLKNLLRVGYNIVEATIKQTSFKIS